MRVSRRFEGHIWLAGWSGESDAPWLLHYHAVQMTFTDCLEQLGTDYGLVAVFERDGDEYQLRCYPVRIGGAGELPQWAASYRARSLDYLPAAALTDYTMAKVGNRMPIFSRAEFQRWVP